jgi:hypothetical protein
MDFYKWFFLEEGRTPAGLFSFSHIFAVTITLVIFLTLAVFLGKRFKSDPKKQNLVLLISGIAIVVVQLSKNIWLLCETDNFWDCLVGNWPLYFCDVPIYIIPLAALTKGRFKQWCLDFMAICGLLMGFMGNYFAGNLYPSHAIISFSVINALLNHSISAFVGLFIWVSGLNKMEKRDIPFAIGILFTFMSIALIVDYISIPIIGRERNFMFFFHGDGTPFTLFLDLYKGALIPYQITIYVLQCGYMGLFYLVYYWIMGFLKKREEHKKLQAQDSTSSN